MIVRELNDAFRKGERPELGRIMITTGVRELVAAWALGVLLLVDIVKDYSDFNAGNCILGANEKACSKIVSILV